MPALSYKERFVPFVKNGTKPHSIRSYRRNPFREGQTIMHYWGMRTKHCMKIREDTVCTGVRTIYILPDGQIFLSKVCAEKEAAERILASFLKGIQYWGAPEDELRGIEKDRFAWRDGFRPEGSSYRKPTGAAELMLRWWKQTHSLESGFTGQVIYWQP